MGKFAVDLGDVTMTAKADHRVHELMRRNVEALKSGHGVVKSLKEALSFLDLFMAIWRMADVTKLGLESKNVVDSASLVLPPHDGHH